MAIMRVRELRKAARLSQTQLASAMGVTQTVVSDWEREVYLPPARQLPLMAKILAVPLVELYSEDALASPIPPT